MCDGHTCECVMCIVFSDPSARNIQYFTRQSVNTVLSVLSVRVVLLLAAPACGSNKRARFCCQLRFYPAQFGGRCDATMCSGSREVSV